MIAQIMCQDQIWSNPRMRLLSTACYKKSHKSSKWEMRLAQFVMSQIAGSHFKAHSVAGMAKLLFTAEDFHDEMKKIQLVVKHNIFNNVTE